MSGLPQEIMTIDIERIRKPVRRLRKILKRPPDEPTADKIHKLRTNVRRYEAALAALHRSTDKKQKKLLKDLSKVRRSAGKIRDMDVLISKVATLEMEEEQDCLVRLLEALEAKRTKHLKKLNTLVEEKGARLCRQLNRESAKVARVLGPSTNGSAHTGPQMATEAASQALRLTRMLKAPAHLSRRNLHPYRLRVRELAYLLQMADSVDQQKYVKKLLNLKDIIGEWHDWGELLHIAGDVLQHGKECKLVRSLRI